MFPAWTSFPSDKPEIPYVVIPLSWSLAVKQGLCRVVMCCRFVAVPPEPFNVGNTQRHDKGGLETLIQVYIAPAIAVYG